MESLTPRPVRFEHYRNSKQYTVIGYAVFALSLLLACICGSFSPVVFDFVESEITNATVSPSDPGMIEWEGVVSQVTPANQFILFSAQFQNPEHSASASTTYSYVQDLTVSVFGYDTSGDYRSDTGVIIEDGAETQRHVQCAGDWCEHFEVFFTSNVAYEFYRVRVEMPLPGCTDDAASPCDANSVSYRIHCAYISAAYTDFEFTWKAMFALITLGVLLLPRQGYIPRLFVEPVSMWSTPQKWVLGLGCGLVLMNDPLFAIQVYTGDPSARDAASIFAVVCLSAEICGILCFWLCILSDMWSKTRQASMQAPMQSIETILSTSLRTRVAQGMDPACMSHWPKVALCFVIWAFMAGTYSYLRIQQLNDPSYYAAEDLPHFRGLVTSMMVLLAVYFVWLVYLIAKTICNARSLAPGFHFVYVITLATILIVCVGLFDGAFHTVPDAAIRFIVFYGMVNVYVWLLMVVYTPMLPEEANTSISMMTQHSAGTWSIDDRSIEIEMA